MIVDNMAKKLTHKVVISQGGVNATFRLSDKEMDGLRATDRWEIAIILQCTPSLNMRPHVQSMVGLQVCLTIIKVISFGMKNKKMLNC